MANLVQMIFEQFLEIVERLSKNACFNFNECDFDYRVRELARHRLLDVIYVIEDKCGRRRDVLVTIDITSICIEDLISCKWVDYLEKIAREFVHDICPKKLIVVRDEIKGCRPQPPICAPFPCKTVTTIIRKKPFIPKEECEVIIEKDCECVEKCVREPCVPKRQVIVRFENERPWKCGDHDQLVVEPAQKHHDFNTHKGNPDFNHHVWRKCCSGAKQSCCTGCGSH